MDTLGTKVVSEPVTVKLIYSELEIGENTVINGYYTFVAPENGVYEISVDNAYKVTSDSATLTVIAFGITKQPVGITVNEGETAKFTVIATGTGLTYQWQYKTASSTTWKNCPSTTEGYNAAELHPAGTMGRNGHSYRCVITDASGNKVTSDAAILTVS